MLLLVRSPQPNIPEASAADVTCETECGPARQRRYFVGRWVGAVLAVEFALTATVVVEQEQTPAGLENTTELIKREHRVSELEERRHRHHASHARIVERQRFSLSDHIDRLPRFVGVGEPINADVVRHGLVSILAGAAADIDELVIARPRESTQDRANETRLFRHGRPSLGEQSARQARLDGHV